MLGLAEFFETYPFLLKPQRRVLVACSGGPDSVALLYALKSLQASLKLHVAVGHVNHQLRGNDSKADEQFVRRLAQKWNLSCVVVSRPRPRNISGNLEEWARDSRYQALLQMAERLHASTVLTAHTLDDQAETVLMNIIRGSGVDGLSGMAPVRRFPRKNVWLARPLMDLSKQELLSFLRRSRLHYRMDKTNQSKKFLRNWLRHDVIPSVERRSPGLKTG